jgi:hypothetical protein
MHEKIEATRILKFHHINWKTKNLSLSLSLSLPQQNPNFSLPTLKLHHSNPKKEKPQTFPTNKNPPTSFHFLPLKCTF